MLFIIFFKCNIDNTSACGNMTRVSTKSCLNGGFMLSTRSECVCPPGFKGQFCEIGNWTSIVVTFIVENNLLLVKKW